MKNNNKGFTLVEVIAAISVLAIIAIIAVPRIISVISRSQLEAAILSAQGYVDTVNYKLQTNTISDDIPSVEYEVFQVNANKLGIKYEGQNPSAGEYTVVNDKVKEAKLCISAFSIKYDSTKATKEEKYQKSTDNYCEKF